MKKLFNLLLCFFVLPQLYAQAPQRISYQAVIRNSSNNLVLNTPVKIRISILQGGATGSEIFSEIHSAITNANGLVSLEIGAGGSQTGNVANINWGNNTYFLKTQTDPNNGTNYTITGTTQILSVPYALQANNANSAKDGINRISNFGDTLVLNDGRKIIIPDLSRSNNGSDHFNKNLVYGSVTDVEGNVYKTIKIGTQEWMAENLRVSRFPDGSRGRHEIEDNLWRDAIFGDQMYCYPNDDAADNLLLGKLYTWEMASLACPTGWHLPTDPEWTLLEKNLGGAAVAGFKMKSISSLWYDQNVYPASNSSGFSALPVGYRDVNGYYTDETLGVWWTATNNGGNFPFYRSADYFVNDLIRGNVLNRRCGLSVRCVKN